MPQTFGRYELGELLGRGGMGEVYRAYDTVRERHIALKLLPLDAADDEAFTVRFRRESRLAAQLNEPHIIPIHDFGEIDGRLFIDMRLVEGIDLGKLIQQRRHLPPRLAVDIVEQVASGLDAAHAMDLVHRDVKPSNVLLTGLSDDPARTPFAYLVDFGIVRSMTDKGTSVTTTGTVGTVAYMAPERIAGQPGDHRSDVYALGCVLYEALTGTQPFHGEMFAVMYAHLNSAPPTPSVHVPAVPAALDAVAARAMAKSPDDRYDSAGELAAAAAAALRAAGPVGRVRRAAPPPTRTPPSGAPRRAAPSATPPSATPPSATPPSATPPSATPPSATPPSVPVYRPPTTPPAETGRTHARRSPANVARQRADTDAPTARSGPIPPPQRPEGAARGIDRRMPALTRTRALVAAGCAVLVAVAVTVVAMTAGGGSGGTPTPSPTADPSAVAAANNAVAATARAQLTPGGSATWELSATITNFNPWSVAGYYSDTPTVVGPLLPSTFLITGGGTPTVDTDYFSSIAMTASNPLTIRYTINPKAVWSDGSHLSWLDFAGMWKAMNGRTPDYNAYTNAGYAQIASVTAGADASQVIVKYAAPFPDWQALFSPLLPASVTSSTSAFNSAWAARPLVTSGPFRWDSSGSAKGRYTVTRNPGWWGDPAELDRLVFTTASSQANSIEAIGKGQADYDDVTIGDEGANIAAGSRFKDVSVRTGPSDAFRLLVMNAKDRVLANQSVRQAVVLGLNRNALAAQMLSGVPGMTPEPMQNHIYLNSQAGYAATCGSLCAQNIQQAQRLLASAGYRLTNGSFESGRTPIVLTMVVPDHAPQAIEEARSIKASLHNIGVGMKTEVLSATAFTTALREGKFQLTVYGLVSGPYPTAFGQLYPSYSTTPSDLNYGGGGSTSIDALRRQASTTLDLQQAVQLDNAASKLMWTNATWVPLYQEQQVTLVKSSLVNIGANGVNSIRWQDIGYRK